VSDGGGDGRVHVGIVSGRGAEVKQGGEKDLLFLSLPREMVSGYSPGTLPG
jgi:hypothetical protein